MGTRRYDELVSEKALPEPRRIITKSFGKAHPSGLGVGGKLEADGDAARDGGIDAESGSGEEIEPVVPHAEVEVSAIEEAFVVAGEASGEDVEAEIEVAGVGERGDEAAVGSESGGERGEKEVGALQVFEDVGAENSVEVFGGEGGGETGVEVGFEEADMIRESGGAGVFDGGNAIAAIGEEAGEMSGSGAEVEHGVAAAGRGEVFEQEGVARVGAVLELVVGGDQ